MPPALRCSGAYNAAGVPGVQHPAHGGGGGASDRSRLPAPAGAAVGADKAPAALAEFRRLQPDYSISNFRAEKISDNPTFIAQHERYYAGLRKAGLPE